MGKNLQKCVFMAHRHGPRLMYILQGYQGDIRCGGQIVMRSKPPDTFLLPGSRAAPLTSQCLILHLRSPSPLLICSFSAPHCFNSHTTKKKNRTYQITETRWTDAKVKGLFFYCLQISKPTFNKFLKVWQCYFFLFDCDERCYTFVHHIWHYRFEYFADINFGITLWAEGGI